MQETFFHTIHSYLIIGSGKSSAQAIILLLESNPNLHCTIISPEISSEWQELLQKNPQFVWEKRAFRKTDLDTQALIIWDKTSKKSRAEKSNKYRKLAFQLSALFLATFFGYGFSTIVSVQEFQNFASQIPKEFYGMLLVGFFAQLVDGAVGLGYGVTCATSMMLLGIKSTAISGSIHTAEMFSSGITGYSHYRFGNVNKRLLWWLAGFGVLGAICGALLLSFLGNQFESITYGILAVYSMFLAARLIVIAFGKKIAKKKIQKVGLLAFLGGFLDAFSGGGWGPIVTSTLLSSGRKSKFVVGTVSLSEFFVTLSASIVFFSILGVSHWHIILGLILGGVVAAPLAARLAGKLPQKTALLVVAGLVIVFSIKVLMKIL
jgi:uncharacterized membrane protein YfcA